MDYYHYTNYSREPLEFIRINECDVSSDDLITKRFRTLWNEIERLREGYRKIINSSDSEMLDGDLARDIARQMVNDE